jgi:hypothetical protein
MSKTTRRAVLFAVATLLLLAALPAVSAPPSQGNTGYCTCGCSFVKDCRTSADCGGRPCLKGPTCCLLSF